MTFYFNFTANLVLSTEIVLFLYHFHENIRCGKSKQIVSNACPVLQFSTLSNNKCRVSVIKNNQCTENNYQTHEVETKKTCLNLLKVKTQNGLNVSEQDRLKVSPAFVCLLKVFLSL